jgi:hypothetical protein
VFIVLISFALDRRVYLKTEEKLKALLSHILRKPLIFLELSGGRVPYSAIKLKAVDASSLN